MSAGWKVSSLKIFQVLWVRRLYKSIATIEFLKNKVVQRSDTDLK